MVMVMVMVMTLGRSLCTDIARLCRGPSRLREGLGGSTLSRCFGQAIFWASGQHVVMSVVHVRGGGGGGLPSLDADPVIPLGAAATSIKSGGFGQEPEEHTTITASKHEGVPERRLVDAIAHNTTSACFCRGLQKQKEAMQK